MRKKNFLDLRILELKFQVLQQNKFQLLEQICLWHLKHKISLVHNLLGVKSFDKFIGTNEEIEENSNFINSYKNTQESLFFLKRRIKTIQIWPQSDMSFEFSLPAVFFVGKRLAWLEADKAEEGRNNRRLKRKSKEFLLLQISSAIVISALFNSIKIQ